MNQSATTTKRVFALAAALAVALACVFALTHTQAFAEDRSVSTWEEFVAAMGQADGDTITITSDIQATESIEVPKNVTIKGDSDNTSYRGPGLGG
ncbi:MAG: hypothetical protein IJ131_05925, partial [Eggerthellaceae bacterium]|nr:hypothetical protein [Eggerthellaceae bacterium]MBQ9068590.1 hypothetical protein [Eggerthellaceae bacterium]